MASRTLLCWSMLMLVSDVATRVRTPPTILEQANQMIAYKIGESLKLSCRADGVPTPTYFWHKDGHSFDVSGNDNRVTQQPNEGTIVINDPLKKDEGTYQCFARNQAGTAATQKTILIVAQLDTFAPLKAPKAHYAKVGEPMSLICTPPKSIPQAQIYWTKVFADGRLESVINTNRVSIDYYGNLHFTNLLKSDQLEPGARYQCSVDNKVERKVVSGQDQVIYVEGEHSVGSPPRIVWTTQDNRPVALRGGRFKMKCIFGGMPTPRVTWRKMEGRLPAHVTTDSFGQELVINNVQYSDAGNYECQGLNDQAANAERKPFLVRVESKPFWIEKPVSAMRGENEDVTLICNADGQPTPSISWFINGVPVEKVAGNPRRRVTPHSIEYTNLQLTDTEVVQCNASNSHGYIFANAYVTVLAVPPNWFIPPPPRAVFAEGKTVNITCQTQAAPRAQVTWSKDGLYLTGGRYHIFTNGNLRINDLVSTDAGHYRCTASNPLGSINGTSDVFVRQSTRIVTRPVDMWVDAKKEAKFICTATTDPENLNELQIIWSKSGQAINFAHQSTTLRLMKNERDNALTITDVDIIDSARYTCTAKTSYDSDSASAFLKVRAPPLAPSIQKVDCTSKYADNIAVVKFQPSGSNYAPILAYYLQYNTGFTADKWTTALIIQEDLKDTRVDVQMSPWVNYTFRVLARNRLGMSLPGEPSKETCRTPPAPPISNPVNVRVRGTSPTNLVIMWTIMVPEEHNALGFKYSVSWECVDEACRHAPERYRGRSEISNYLQNMLVVEHQLTYKRYRVVVLATNERGTSLAPATDVYGYSGSNAPSVAPNYFQSIVVGSTSATFSWRTVPNDPRVIRGELKGYMIKYRFRIGKERRPATKIATFFFDHITRTNATDIPTTATVPVEMPDVPNPNPNLPPPSTGDNVTPRSGGGSSPARVRRSDVTITDDVMIVNVENLPPASEIELTVAAVNEAYVGPESDPVIITTLEGVPGPVARLYPRRLLSNRIVLGWDPPEEPNGLLTGYVMAHAEVNGLHIGDWDWDPDVKDPEIYFASISGLRPSQIYRFYVYAVTGRGRGEVNYIDIATISAASPSPPTFTVTDVGENFINVTWVPSRTGNPGSVFYVQYRRKGRPSWEPSRVEALHDWLEVTSLEPGTQYEVRVVARNGIFQEAHTYAYVVTTKGYSARLDLIVGHAWFISIFLLVLILIGVCVGALYWKKKIPARYPDTSEAVALRADLVEKRAGDLGSDDMMYVRNRGYEKASTESLGDGAGMWPRQPPGYVYEQARNNGARYPTEDGSEMTPLDRSEIQDGSQVVDYPPEYDPGEIIYPERDPTLV